MLTCRDEADYMELQGKLANYEAAVVLLYGKDKRCFSPEEITALGVPIPSNDERSAVEAWEFQHTQRDRYTAYVDFDKTKCPTAGCHHLNRLASCHGYEYLLRRLDEPARLGRGVHLVLRL